MKMNILVLEELSLFEGIKLLNSICLPYCIFKLNDRTFQNQANIFKQEAESEILNLILSIQGHMWAVRLSDLRGIRISYMAR